MSFYVGGPEQSRLCPAVAENWLNRSYDNIPTGYMHLQALLTFWRKRPGGLFWSETRDGYLFILRWLLGFIIFSAEPMLASL